MEFRECSIAGITYAEKVDPMKKARAAEGEATGQYDFKQLLQNEKSSDHTQVVQEFLTLLATCHTVIPEKSDTDPEQIAYQASSPDEGALVSGAALLEYQFNVFFCDIIKIDPKTS